MARVPSRDEYAEDSSDEEDVRNTVGNVPLEWYEDFPHVGYDLDGRRIYKPLRTRDELDDPDFWRTVKDRMTGQDLRLTDEQVALLQRLQRGQFGDVSFDPYEPAVDFFSGNIMIHPVTNRPEDKRSFIPSLVEKEKVSRMVHAIKMGWIQPRRSRDSTPRFYDLWAQEDPNAVLGRPQDACACTQAGPAWPHRVIQLPPEYLPSEEEHLVWAQQEPGERKLNFLPRKFPSLRAVPAYGRFSQERFERCLDLYLCPRQRKMRCLPRGPVAGFRLRRWLDGSLRLWEEATARCMRVVPVGGVVRSVAWNPNPSICLVAAAVDDAVLLLNPVLGDPLLAGSTDQLLSAFALPE
ncbi:Ribosome biogenesis protein BOP1 [Sciurus carolinensis]|uniref:Ribosome biogenesis protein BOP1 n=1 Tax=Sciurus carolinensis TaxID=30640 RepID=A0AA41NGK9_SCICA|nr:Ribosome biogenesis protein BOP1 [Sciurus carolinensis]